MIASSIGKIFLKGFNKRKGTAYSAKEFFEKEFHELFFDHPKYMQWITNSPFVQGLTTDDKGRYGIEIDRMKFLKTDQKEIEESALKKLKTKYETELGKERISTKTDNKGKKHKIILLNDHTQRVDRVNTLYKKLEKKEIDASTAIGYPPGDALATTSGQLTNLDLPLEEDDFYASWIGGGFGVGVQGGFSIYFDDPEILWTIYEGWSEYRDRLIEIDELRANQIDSWNGQWLLYKFNENHLAGEIFNPIERVTSGKYKGLLEVPTAPWSEVLLGIALAGTDRILNGYVFSIGDINKTIGFIPFHLPQVQRPVQFYIELFGKSEYLENARLIRSLYGTALGFVQACQMGVIGVRAMEPKDLKPYMIDQRKKSKLPDFSKADEKQQISFKTYQTWLLAMLDNKQLWDKAGEAAQAYLQYEAEDKKNSTKHWRNIEAILDSTGKKPFIQNNLPVIESRGESTNSINELVENVNSMPEDSFRYYLILIKFRYTFLKNQKK